MTREAGIDCTPFADLMREALEGYRRDPAYAIEMMERASVILARRRAWELRSELRAAEGEAMAACQRAKPFTCDSTALMCGVGPGCRFAAPALADIELVPVPFKSVRSRPQERPQRTSSGEPGTSWVEAAVHAVHAALRQGVRVPVGV